MGYSRVIYSSRSEENHQSLNAKKLLGGSSSGKGCDLGLVGFGENGNTSKQEKRKSLK